MYASLPGRLRELELELGVEAVADDGKVGAKVEVDDTDDISAFGSSLAT